jgi:hypothetical protein
MQFTGLLSSQMDLFAYTTWGLANEIALSGKIPIKPYENWNYLKYSYAIHPNDYSEMFYPHVMLYITRIIITLPYEYYSYIITFLLVLVFYLVLSALSDQKILIAFATLSLLLMHRGYPSFSFFYISLGLLMFWYVLYILIRGMILKGTSVSADIILIILFTLASNWSYYSSTYLIFSYSLFISIIVLSKRLPFIHQNRIEILTTRNTKPLALVTLITSAGFLFLLNPIVRTLKIGHVDIGSTLLNPIQNIIGRIIQEQQPIPGFYVVQFRDVLYGALVRVSITSTLILVFFFIITYVLKERVYCDMLLERKFFTALISIIALSFVSLTFAIAYELVGFPQLHLYPSNIIVAKTITSIGTPLILVKCYDSKKERIIRFLSIILAILVILAPIYASVTNLIYGNPYTPKELYNEVIGAINFATRYAKNDVFFVSDKRIAALMYYKSTELGISTKIVHSLFTSNPLNYNDNCVIKDNCIYILTYSYSEYPIRGGGPWELMPPLGETLYIMLSNNSLIYNDGYSILMLVLF